MESRPPDTASNHRPRGIAASAPWISASTDSLPFAIRVKYARQHATTFDEPRSKHVESNFGGPLGTLIAGLGMGAYYIGLTWINMLLGLVLTPFFIIPATWVMDAMAKKKAQQG